MHSRLIARQCTVFLIISLGILGFSIRATAAEKVVLKYSILQLSIPVSDLEKLANTGEMSSELNSLLSVAKADPESVRRALNQPIKIRATVLDEALNSTPGELILDQVGAVIHTSGNAEDRKALRSALILSASDDNQLTLLETIQKYPTEEVYVEGEKLVEAYNAVSSLGEKISSITEQLKKLLEKIKLP